VHNVQNIHIGIFFFRYIYSHFARK